MSSTETKTTWLVTGAARGMGTEIAHAALRAGHQVVATGRTPKSVRDALGGHENLFVHELDVTDHQSAERAVQASIDRFARIDVLVNNAGNFYAGFFEELSPEQVRAQIETNLFGPMIVTRVVLPVMRAQRSGLLIAISSSAGLIGLPFCTAYSAAKFGVEGFMESLAPEIAPFDIRTMLVEPGSFRTELLQPESTSYAKASIDDYGDRTDETIAAWQGRNGQQPGDPAKFARALVQLVDSDQPPQRWVAGADIVIAAEQKAHTLLEQIDAHRELSSSLAHDIGHGTAVENN